MEQTPENVQKLIEECKITGTKKLDLSNRKLKNVPREILNLKHLQILYLERNELEELPDDFASMLLNLKWLDIRHNNLTSLPRNIFLLKNLRNLLLEGNNLVALPLELGLLSSLSGLNLAGNPLEVPPRDIVESGTKVILQYLREQLAIEQRFGNLEIEDEGNNNEEKVNYAYKENSDKQSLLQEESERAVAKSRALEYNRNQHRRYSLEEEEMLNSPPYVINPLDIKERIAKPKQERTRENTSSAPPQRTSKKKKSKFSNDDRQARSDYLRRGTIDSSHLKELELAEKREFNEKVDSILQKKRDKTNLDDWRRKTRLMQRTTRSKKHEVKMPFGSDLQPDPEKMSKHAEDVKGVLAKDKVARLRQLRDQQLEERIREHAKHIREWRQRDKLNKRENELQAAKENLDIALNLQRDLEEKRALQYRLRAFTAEDFAPKSHADNYERKLS